MWTTGELLEERYDPLQLELHHRFTNMAPRSQAFILESRKIGKTYGFLCYADQLCRKKPKSIVRFAYPTKLQGKTIILPLMEEMQQDCPTELRWVNREAQDGCWVLPHTGSRLYLAGTDDADQVDRLRGPKSDLNILDEVPTFKAKTLDYLVNSVLWPQTLNTGGLTLMSGTPPESLDHPSMEFVEQARQEGNLVTKTIFDNPRLTPEIIRKICKQANRNKERIPYEDYETRITRILSGEIEGTPHWEREFMCRMVADKEMRVCPEYFSKDHMLAAPTGFPALRFVFIDPGHVKDFFAAVFCELNYNQQRLYVRRDYHSLRKSTGIIKAELLKIEKDLGWDRGLGVTRYIDETAKQQITDFNDMSYFVLPALHSPGKGQLVVPMRNLFEQDMIGVDPQCQNLISCLENGLWSDTMKEDFRRSEALGHLDSLDALAQGCMMLRWTAQWQVNPYPKGSSDYQPGIVIPSAPRHLTSTRTLGYHVSKMLPRGRSRGHR